MARKVFKGWISMECQELVTNGLAANTEVAIPGLAYPENPDNKERPLMVNAAGEASVEYEGKKTPTIRVMAAAKTSWYTASFITSIILGLNASNDTPTWAIGLNDTNGTRVYDGCKCERIIVTGSPTLRQVIMDFKAIYGDSESGSPTSFSAPSTDAGLLIKASQCGWTNATADLVREWGLVIERDQMWDMVANESAYATAIRSGALRFALALGQDPDASNSPEAVGTTSGSAVLKTGASGSGCQFTLKVSRDSSSTPHIPGIVTRTKTYSGIDLSDGAGMIAVVAVP